MRLTELMRPEVAADLQPDHAPFYEGGTDPVRTEDYLIELRTAAGGYRWFSGKGQPVVDAAGTPQGVVVGLRDVTELVAARTEAQDREARRKAIVDSLLDPHVLLQAVRDSQGAIVDFIYADANDAACDYMHIPHGELVGARLLDLLPGQAGSGMLDLYAHALHEGVPLVLDDYAYPHEILGSERRYDIRGLGVGDALSLTWRDVTERHQAVWEMNRRARHDGLTGLLNREAVFDTLNALLGQRPRTGHDVAVAFCDLDGFKDINDTHGHQMGDFVLRTVGTHIRGLLRADDLVARLGGDEFLLILPGVHGLESAVEVAEKVRQHCAEPHQHDGLTYRPLVSIGVTLLRRGEDADELIARADRAMYRAKAAGGNRVVAVE
ncbi:MAG: hypothetical protein RLZ55_317 [Actinomycetota bacterium]